MLAKHRGRELTEKQRRRWVSLLCDAADDVALPADPEFRSAFVAYIEWGTRLAMANSQPGAEPPPEAPVPRWGWGEAPPACQGLRRGLPLRPVRRSACARRDRQAGAGAKRVRADLTFRGERGQTPGRS